MAIVGISTILHRLFGFPRSGAKMQRRCSQRKPMAVIIGLLNVCVFASAHAANDDKFRAVLIYSSTVKFDKSYNEAAYNGLTRFINRYDEPVAERLTGLGESRREILRDAARRYQYVIVTDERMVEPLLEIAPEFPSVRFTAIDQSLEGKNIRSVTFRNHEGSFLAGMVAAMTSHSRKVGFIGGSPSPVMSQFFGGFRAGVNFVDSEIQVQEVYVADPPSAAPLGGWDDPYLGLLKANQQFEWGADVIFAAAGGSGLGVYQAARDNNRFAIGVDSNQNYLHPGNMLTSMIKRIDSAVFETLRVAYEGEWEATSVSIGLIDEGMDVAVDDYNRELITDVMKDRVEAARRAIISGSLKVPEK